MSDKSSDESQEANEVADAARRVLTHFLSEVDIPYPSAPPDSDLYFEGLCRTYLHHQLGCGPDSPVLPYLSVGVVMSTTAYAHLKDTKTRVFIALYTTFLTFLDDVAEMKFEAVQAFNGRYVDRDAQLEPHLQALDILLREIPDYWSPMLSNMIVTSTLNLVTALLLEHEMKDVEVHHSALLFPTFSRVMSGAAEAYAIFMFPPEIPAAKFVQALPYLMEFINGGNDILSFYKEELAGESLNRVSLLASLTRSPKSQHIEAVVEEVIECHRRVVDILSRDGVATNVFRAFSSGYVGFHAMLQRYRLSELDL